MAEINSSDRDFEEKSGWWWNILNLSFWAWFVLVEQLIQKPFLITLYKKWQMFNKRRRPGRDRVGGNRIQAGHHFTSHQRQFNNKSYHSHVIVMEQAFNKVNG